MSHLLAISVGPVQEFIAAARRTRDLWFGSHLLSEISKAIARSVGSHGTLIFPHPGTDLDSGNDNVANVILANLNSGDPRAIAAAAREEGRRRWRQFAEQAFREVSPVIRDGVWSDQVDDVIEFSAAWVSRSENYPQDRTRVMRLLAGRKNCRVFKQPLFNDAGLPKSSLDGQRPTVLEANREHWPAESRRKLRLSSGEQLDVVGVVKRVAGGTQSYPSVARVAAETWLRGLENQGQLDRLRTACEKLAARGLHTVREKNYGYFPYEGTIIYQNRHLDLRSELGLQDHDLKEVTDALKPLRGEPSP